MQLKRRKLLIALLACGLITLATFIVFHKPEPSYKGKSLTTWVSRLFVPRSTDRSEAEEAIKAIGTNAVPHLLQWLTESKDWDDVYHPTLRRLMQKSPLLNKNKRLQTWINAPVDRLLGIPEAFEILGSDALPAIPPLATIIVTSTNPLTAGLASHALTRIGPPAILPLIRCLDDPNPKIAKEAARTLGELGDKATPALPALTNALQHSTGSSHLAISNAIREIHSPSPLPRFD